MCRHQSSSVWRSKFSSENVEENIKRRKLGEICRGLERRRCRHLYSIRSFRCFPSGTSLAAWLSSVMRHPRLDCHRTSSTVVFIEREAAAAPASLWWFCGPGRAALLSALGQDPSERSPPDFRDLSQPVRYLPVLARFNHV